MKQWLPLLGLCPMAWAQCPLTPSPHFDCTSAGGNTQITLFQNAELQWDRFDVPAGGSLNITSDGGLFSSKHLTSGSFPSAINGSITADGAFTLVNTAGIRVGSGGLITAPSLTLSSLSAITPDSYRGSLQAGQMIINGNLNATSGNATLLSYQTTINGSITAPAGKVTLISTGSEIISGPNFRRSGERLAESKARVTTRRNLEAPIIEIYSEGFIENSGRIAGDQVTLEANAIAHNRQPGSVINSPNLLLIPNTLLEGAIVKPNDGSNPGGISTTLGLPDLASGSFTGKQKTTLLPTQFSASRLKSSRVPSAVSQKAQSASRSRLATRGTPPTKPKKSAKKSSFFGIVTIKK
ncbi:hypothetical protein V2O64_14075 [Verrucomicrobiaceae bacterium 227]